MNNFRSKIWKSPKKPIRLVIVVFFCLAGLFLFTAPFMNDINKLKYIIGGIFYSAFLSYAGVGIALLKEKGKKLFLKVFIPVLSLVLLIMIAMFLITNIGYRGTNPERAIDIIGIIIKISFVLSYPLGMFIASIPAWGWINYFKNRKA